MNTNTVTFTKQPSTGALITWLNERGERVVINPPGAKARVLASKSLLSPMIDAVMEAQKKGERAVEVSDTRGW